MSDPPTLHRDLTSKNILLDRFLRAKIAGTTYVIVALTPLYGAFLSHPVRSTVQHTDFGLSRFKEENGVFTQGCGALAFMVRFPATNSCADVHDAHTRFRRPRSTEGKPTAKRRTSTPTPSYDDHFHRVPCINIL